MAMASQGAKGRQLGMLEVFYDIASKKHGLFHYYQHAVLRSNCRISIKDFCRSVEVLVNLQPLLRMQVVKKLEEGMQRNVFGNDPPRERFFFEPCDVDYDEVIRARKRNSDDDFDEIIREEDDFLAGRGGYGEGPRWRIVFNMPNDADENTNPEHDKIYKYEVFFRLHHQIVDGVSGYDILHGQLLPIMNNIINELPVDEVFTIPLDLTPSYEEDILGDPLSGDKGPAWYARAICTVLRGLTHLFKKDIYTEPLIKSKGAPFDDREGSGIFKFSFKIDLVGQILHERKMQNVTVHSILLTGFSFAVAKLLEDLGEEIPKEIKSGWPIDSRKKLPKYKSPQPLGLFVGTSGKTSFNVPKPSKLDREIFWNSAKDIDRQVINCKEKQREEFSIETVKYMAEKLKNEDFKDLMRQFGVKDHFTLSNVGKCAPGPELRTNLQKGIHADEMYFGFHGNSIIAEWVPFFISALYHKGKIFFGITYQKAWIEIDLAEKLAKYTEEILYQVCEKLQGSVEE